MIDMILFSKDRPAQLKLFLDHCPSFFRPFILYKYSNEEYKKGYYKLFKWIDQNIEKCSYIEETNFRKDTLFWADCIKSKCCCINTDDSLFYRPFKLSDDQLFDVFEETGAKSFQCRLGLNTILQKYYEPKQYYTDIMPTYLKDGIMGWNFRKHDYSSTNRGRPISLDGGIHPTEFFRDILHNTNWHNPRELDGISTDGFGDTMLSFTRSCLVCNSVNLAFAGGCGYADNYGHYYKYSLEDLNREWLAGKTPRAIFNPDDIISAHTEVPLDMI